MPVTSTKKEKNLHSYVIHLPYFGHVSEIWECLPFGDWAANKRQGVGEPRIEWPFIIVSGVAAKWFAFLLMCWKITTEKFTFHYRHQILGIRRNIESFPICGQTNWSFWLNQTLRLHLTRSNSTNWLAKYFRDSGADKWLWRQWWC